MTCATVLAALAVAGCGGDGSDDAAARPLQPSEAKRCLERAGYKVISSAVDTSKDEDAPDHELIVTGDRKRFRGCQLPA